jgi:uncharacterized protein (DUF924 family)
MESYKEIINFWFKEVDQSDWFNKNDKFDELIINKYSNIHSKAAKCELYEWRKNAEGRLAEIIILDQFSRNMFRGSILSFACDSMALSLSQEAILIKADEELTEVQRNFLYMPFMHSESLEIHKIAMDLYRKNGSKASLDYEIKHKNIIEKFGRYPHRNKILGRKSTEKELAFLKLSGSSF